MQAGRVRAAQSRHTMMPVLGRFCSIMSGLTCKILVKVLQSWCPTSVHLQQSLRDLRQLGLEVGATLSLGMFCFPAGLRQPSMLLLVRGQSC